MTRHSTLNNADDLHYAKIRIFTGNPNAIAPDFINQLFAATDTNKTYRAIGVTSGAIVELSPSVPSNNGQQASSAISTFSGLPSAITPDFVNQLFVATDTNKMYRSSGVAVGNLIELLSTPLPPVSVAPEWLDLLPDTLLEAGKSYINTGQYYFIVTLPLGFLSGQSINLFSTGADLLLNSQGIELVLPRNTVYAPSPYPEGGSNFIRNIPRYQIIQLTFNGQINRWIVTQGTIGTEQFLQDGCTDSAATNYDPLATVDDGSCIYVLGCMDSEANNYDPLATADDGSCTY